MAPGKIPMQICLGMGILGYVIIYASAIWVKSYYLFMLGTWAFETLGGCFGSRVQGLGSIESIGFRVFRVCRV